MLPGATPVDAHGLATRLCEAARGCWHGIRLTLSVGVGTCWGAEANFETPFAQADRALYAAKAAGRDRVGSSQKTPAGVPLLGAPA